MTLKQHSCHRSQRDHSVAKTQPKKPPLFPLLRKEGIKGREYNLQKTPALKIFAKKARFYKFEIQKIFLCAFCVLCGYIVVNLLNAELTVACVLQINHNIATEYAEG